MSTTQQPPAAAVDRDAHWKRKVQRLRNRNPLEMPVTLHDEDAGRAVQDAERALIEATMAARVRRSREIRAERPEVTDLEILELIEPDLDQQPEMVQAQEDLDAAKAEQAEADVTFVFRALPADVWEELIEKFPPTEKQERAGQTYNVDRFGPVLLAACSVDPLTEQEAAELIGGEWYDDSSEDPTEHGWRQEHASLSQGEAAFLFTNAVAVNQAARVSLGKGSRPTPG